MLLDITFRQKHFVSLADAAFFNKEVLPELANAAFLNKSIT
jgi:hypothetical protein